MGQEEDMKGSPERLSFDFFGCDFLEGSLDHDLRRFGWLDPGAQHLLPTACVEIAF
jgi:hypothetical protein